jgi:hypothetical protein
VRDYNMKRAAEGPQCEYIAYKGVMKSMVKMMMSPMWVIICFGLFGDHPIVTPFCCHLMGDKKNKQKRASKRFLGSKNYSARTLAPKHNTPCPDPLCNPDC